MKQIPTARHTDRLWEFFRSVSLMSVMVPAFPLPASNHRVHTQQQPIKKPSSCNPKTATCSGKNQAKQWLKSRGYHDSFGLEVDQIDHNDDDAYDIDVVLVSETESDVDKHDEQSSLEGMVISFSAGESEDSTASIHNATNLDD